MRIAVVAPSISRLAGGMFNSVRRLSQCVGRLNGNCVEVFSLKDIYSAEDSDSWAPLRVHTAYSIGPSKIGLSFALRRYVARFQPEIVHAHGIWKLPTALGCGVARKLRQPYLVSVRGMLDTWALQQSRLSKTIAGWAYEKGNLARAQCLHALNSQEVHAIRTFGLTNPVCVVPNGVDLPSPSEVFHGQHLPIDIEKDKQVLLYLGRLHQKKGLQELLLAWRSAQQSARSLARDWVLAIAGWDDGLETSLRRACVEANLGTSVHFVGPCYGDAKDAWLRRASALVLPSRSEGLPMAVLEAWAYKLPVLMTRECNLMEGFDFGAALQIGTSPRDIEKGLLELFASNDLTRRAIGKKGFALVAERYSWSRVSEYMQLVYGWLVGGGQPPDCVQRGR